jgi:lysophospholipase L1-like esterase
MKRGYKMIRWMNMLFIVACLIFGNLFCGGVEVNAATKAEKSVKLNYVALGDSIPNGYVCSDSEEITSYPKLLAEDIEKIGDCKVKFSGYTKNGITTEGLYEKYLSDPDVQQKLKEANIITVTVGSNDLLNEVKSVAQDILDMDTEFDDMSEALDALQEGISDNPMLLIRLVKAISSWNYDAFEEDWNQTLEVIRENCDEETQIVVTTIYNPVAKIELPGTLNTVVETIIGGMNDIIEQYADTYDYQVAELFPLGTENYTQADGLHPNQAGNELIKETIEGKLDFDKLIQITEEAKALIRERAEKIAQMQKERQHKKQMRYVKIGVSVGTVVILVIVLIISLIKRSRKK